MISRILAGVLCFAVFQLHGQFQNVTEMIGEHYVVPESFFGSGVSFYDFDRDGLDDLSIGLGTDTARFFMNDSGTFIPADFDIPTTGNGHIVMMLWADYDNDGDEDLLITKSPGPVELWQNEGNNNFVNVAAEAGIYEGYYNYGGAAFADFNHDGCLDLYIAKFYYHLWTPGQQYQNILYQSNCDGTFTNVTQSSGAEVVPSLTFQPVFFDYNKDGWEDLYLINELSASPNNLFHNNGDGTFTEVSESTGAGIYIDAMTGTVGDFNNDLLLDIFVTNRLSAGGNHLMVDQGDGTYSNQAAQLGLGTNYQSWGSVWLDYDNDGWQDLFVSIPLVGNSGEDGNAFYVNHSGEYFTSERDSLGFSEDFSRTYVCARGDMNNDGYYDLAHSSSQLTRVELYENTGGENNYISVSLEGTVSNRNGIGSWIYCYAGDHQAVHYTMCGENLIGQNSGKQIFGLGEITEIDSVVVEWNRGMREVYTSPEVNQHLHLIEGATFTQPFAISYSGDTALCPGDSLVLNAGEHSSYLWNTGDSTQYLSVSDQGTYFVEVWNEFGISATSFPVEISNHPQTEISTDVNPISCNGFEDGSIEVDFSTGAPDSIAWSNGASDILLENLSEGLYSFSGSDQNGCAIEGEVYVSAPPPLIAASTAEDVLCHGDSSGEASISVLGGTPPYSVDWNGANPEALPAAEYIALVSDANGCETALSFEIEQPDSMWIELEVNAATNGNNGSVTAQIFGGTPPFELQWSTGTFESTLLEGLTPGEYSLLVTDDNGCSKQKLFEVETEVSIAWTEEKLLRIFPNPASNFAVLEGAMPGSELKIYDLSGRIVLQKQVIQTPTRIDVSGLLSGQYLVRVRQNETESVVRLMLVK